MDCIIKRLLYLFLISIFLICFSGCMTVATTGASVVYNHNSLQKNLNDHCITMQAYRKTYLDTDEYKNTNISITTLNQEVLLTGEILGSTKRNDIEKIIKKIPGVKKVYNLTVLSTPSSSLTRVSDTWITTKIKAKLIAADDIDPSQFTVLTENGTVYLMGTVLPQHADAAVRIARTTAGVQSVVKIFSYIKISKEV